MKELTDGAKISKTIDCTKCKTAQKLSQPLSRINISASDAVPRRGKGSVYFRLSKTSLMAAVA